MAHSSFASSAAHGSMAALLGVGAPSSYDAYVAALEVRAERHASMQHAAQVSAARTALSLQQDNEAAFARNVAWLARVDAALEQAAAAAAPTAMSRTHLLSAKVAYIQRVDREYAAWKSAQAARRQARLTQMRQSAVAAEQAVAGRVEHKMETDEWQREMRDASLRRNIALRMTWDAAPTGAPAPVAHMLPYEPQREMWSASLPLPAVRAPESHTLPAAAAAAATPNSLALPAPSHAVSQLTKVDTSGGAYQVHAPPRVHGLAAGSPADTDSTPSAWALPHFRADGTPSAAAPSQPHAAFLDAGMSSQASAGSVGAGVVALTSPDATAARKPPIHSVTSPTAAQPEAGAAGAAAAHALSTHPMSGIAMYPVATESPTRVRTGALLSGSSGPAPHLSLNVGSPTQAATATPPRPPSAAKLDVGVMARVQPGVLNDTSAAVSVSVSSPPPPAAPVALSASPTAPSPQRSVSSASTTSDNFLPARGSSPMRTRTRHSPELVAAVVAALQSTAAAPSCSWKRLTLPLLPAADLKAQRHLLMACGLETRLSRDAEGCVEYRIPPAWYADIAVVRVMPDGSCLACGEIGVTLTREATYTSVINMLTEQLGQEEPPVMTDSSNIVMAVKSGRAMRDRLAREMAPALGAPSASAESSHSAAQLLALAAVSEQDQVMLAYTVRASLPPALESLVADAVSCAAAAAPTPSLAANATGSPAASVLSSSAPPGVLLMPSAGALTVERMGLWGSVLVALVFDGGERSLLRGKPGSQSTGIGAVVYHGSPVLRPSQVLRAASPSSPLGSSSSPLAVDIDLGAVTTVSDDDEQETVSHDAQLHFASLQQPPAPDSGQPVVQQTECVPGAEQEAALATPSAVVLTPTTRGPLVPGSPVPSSEKAASPAVRHAEGGTFLTSLLESPGQHSLSAASPPFSSISSPDFGARAHPSVSPAAVTSVPGDAAHAVLGTARDVARNSPAAHAPSSALTSRSPVAPTSPPMLPVVAASVEETAVEVDAEGDMGFDLGFQAPLHGVISMFGAPSRAASHIHSSSAAGDGGTSVGPRGGMSSVTTFGRGAQPSASSGRRSQLLGFGFALDDEDDSAESQSPQQQEQEQQQEQQESGGPAAMVPTAMPTGTDGSGSLHNALVARATPASSAPSPVFATASTADAPISSSAALAARGSDDDEFDVLPDDMGATAPTAQTVADSHWGGHAFGSAAPNALSAGGTSRFGGGRGPRSSVRTSFQRSSVASAAAPSSRAAHSIFSAGTDELDLNDDTLY